MWFAPLLALVLLAPSSGHAASAYVYPQRVLPGEPAVLVASSSVASITVEGRSLPFFRFDGDRATLIGVALSHAPGDISIVTSFADGTRATSTLVVASRARESAPLDIPLAFGGTTPTGAARIVSALATDNKVLASLWSHPRSLWKGSFVLPLSRASVSDTYGYTRTAAGSEIAHKGTDFSAAIGTPVFAMNRGVVRLARSLDTYGKTVAVDHGQGLFTYYMHLSRIHVAPGQLVQKGQRVGASGDTGYAIGPHLHVSVRINGESIDPMRFVELW